MTIYEIKKKLGNNIGKEVSIKYNLGRNKYEEYIAVIKELYDYIFIVDSKYGVKSFSYRDIMTKTIHIDY